MAEALSNPTITINNLTTPIVPNTFTYKSGKGDRTVRTQSSGGGSVQNVFSTDIETNKSMVKFSIFNPKENIDKLEDWQDLLDGNAILATAKNGFSKSFSNMTLITDPEIAFGSDTTIEVEFEGQPAI